jgi:carboxypeptidase Taq
MGLRQFRFTATRWGQRESPVGHFFWEIANAMDAQSAYAELIGRSRELRLLASCSAVLSWDEQTYMPPGAAAYRGEQMAYLAGLHHRHATDPHIGELLDTIERSDLVADPESALSANLRELRRDYRRRTRLPADLVEALARTTSLAQQEWIAARRDSNFERFLPWLDRIVRLKRQQAECLPGMIDEERPTTDGSDQGDAAQGSNLGTALYDALLDEYEPGASSGEMTVLFHALREQLVPLLEEIKEADTRQVGDRDEALLARTYPLERQKVFGEAVAAAVGFDFQRGRLDVTAHPFCTGIGPGDTRITTRYNERDFSDAFFSILHEVGHGLYEQGLPAEHFGTPLGEPASLGVHESQSRLWENAVGRSRAFWRYWFPLAQKVFHSALHGISLDQFLAAVNHVKPSLIRVQADEVTYNLHIIVRFELEQSLLSGDLPTADLPAAWNQKYRDALGIIPANPAEGCLQDIHWSAGLLGYFPTYTLGNLYAAQLFAAARAELTGLEEALARADFAEFLAWLREKIHHHGQRFRPVELIRRATGTPPDHRPLIASLRQKHGELYKL